MAAKKYDVKLDDRMLTPVTLARLNRLIAKGRLKKYHRVWVTGLSRWTKAGDIPELKPFFKKKMELHVGSKWRSVRTGPRYQPKSGD